MSAGLRVGLLFGGRSVEHEVSVVSARGVAEALGQTDLVCVPLAVTGEGRWLSPELSTRVLEAGGPRVDVSSLEDDGVRLLIDPGGNGILRHKPGEPPTAIGIDVVFPLIHGWGGEDGRLQGALELAELPCVGAGVLGSAAGMDKAVAKDLFRTRGLPVAPWTLITRDDHASAPRETRARIEGEIGYPLFVKPANGGSSVGITKVRRGSELNAALELALLHDRRALAERSIDAREIECAVIGNDHPEASGLGEIVPSREYYDYNAKYVDGTSELKIPAELEAQLTDEMRRQAVAAYRALDLAGFARVDFLLERGSDRIFLNEVNTLPGFTPISMFPKLWEAAGLSYPRLIERLVELALDRARSDAARKTRWEGNTGVGVGSMTE